MVKHFLLGITCILVAGCESPGVERITSQDSDAATTETQRPPRPGDRRAWEHVDPTPQPGNALAREDAPSNLPENALSPEAVAALLSGVDLSCSGPAQSFGVAFQAGGGLTIRGFQTRIQGSWTPTRGGIEYRLWSLYEADNQIRWLYVALHPQGIQLGGAVCIEI